MFLSFAKMMSGLSPCGISKLGTGCSDRPNLM